MGLLSSCSAAFAGTTKTARRRLLVGAEVGASRAKPYSRTRGTSLNFLGERARSIARSASAIASDLVAAWPLTVTSSIVADHFQSWRPRPWTIVNCISRCFNFSPSQIGLPTSPPKQCLGPCLRFRSNSETIRLSVISPWIGSGWLTSTRSCSNVA